MAWETSVSPTTHIHAALVFFFTTKQISTADFDIKSPDFVNESKISNAGPYAASKAALSLLVAKLAADYEEEGILFMSLCPGLVDSTEGQAKPRKLYIASIPLHTGCLV